MAGIAFHPWYAVHGTKNFSDGNLWYNTTDTINSLYDCVVNAGTGNGRPDSKEADLSYIEGQGGLLCYSIPNAKTPTYKHQEEVKRNLVDGYIENGVETNYGVTCTSVRDGFSDGGAGNRTYVYLSDGWYTTVGDQTGIDTTFGYIIHSSGVYKISGRNNSGAAILDVELGNISANFTNGDSFFIIHKTKSPYLATQGTMTHTDLIGDPAPYNSLDATYIANDGNTDTDVTDMPTGTLVWNADDGKIWKTKVDTIDLTDSTPSVDIEEGDNWTEVKKGYPVELRNRLASGKGVGFMNALLVGQDGTSYNLQNWNTMIASKKNIHAFDFTRWLGDSSTSYSHGALEDSSTYNTFGTSGVIYSGGHVFLSYQAQNQPAIPVTSIQPIEVVDRELIASDSHTLYAYNGLTYAASGKIATGDSIEAKGLDGTLIAYSNNKIVTDNSTTIHLVENELFTVYGNDHVSDGTILQRLNSDLTGILDSSYNFIDLYDLAYRYIGSLLTTPTHNPLQLDPQSIVGSKSLITQTSSATQVFTQELVLDTSNNDWGDSGKFDKLDSGTVYNLNGSPVQTKVLIKGSSIKIG